MENEKEHFRLSKFLSYVLRHNPQSIGIELDQQGWTDITNLLDKMNAQGKSINREILEYLVANNNKKRYSIDKASNRIRANQGHSVAIDLGYQPQKPPAILYHGTAQQFIDSIFKTGLEKQRRHHVHLSKDVDTASNVGKRHGKVIVLEVLAGQMARDGYLFYVSENGVWLTEEVPTRYLRRLHH